MSRRHKVQHGQMDRVTYLHMQRKWAQEFRALDDDEQALFAGPDAEEQGHLSAITPAVPEAATLAVSRRDGFVDVDRHASSAVSLGQFQGGSWEHAILPMHINEFCDDLGFPKVFDVGGPRGYRLEDVADAAFPEADCQIPHVDPELPDVPDAALIRSHLSCVETHYGFCKTDHADRARVPVTAPALVQVPVRVLVLEPMLIP